MLSQWRLGFVSNPDLGPAAWSTVTSKINTLPQTKYIANYYINCNRILWRRFKRFLLLGAWPCVCFWSRYRRLCDRPDTWKRQPV